MICVDCRTNLATTEIAEGIFTGEPLCESCATAPRCSGCYCRVAEGVEYCEDCEARWAEYEAAAWAELEEERRWAEED